MVSLQALLDGIEGDSRYVPEDIENAIDDGHIT